MKKKWLVGLLLMLTLSVEINYHSLNEETEKYLAEIEGFYNVPVTKLLEKVSSN